MSSYLTVPYLTIVHAVGMNPFTRRSGKASKTGGMHIKELEAIRETLALLVVVFSKASVCPETPCQPRVAEEEFPKYLSTSLTLNRVDWRIFVSVGFGGSNEVGNCLHGTTVTPHNIPPARPHGRFTRGGPA